MKQKIFFLTICFIGFYSCKEDKTNNNEITNKVVTSLTKVPSYTYSELKPLLEKIDDKTYVINFWATWCGPCVKELPAFEKINAVYQKSGVEVVLVSLDFPKQVESKLIPFINKKQLKSKVVLLDDVNEDYWIKAINTNWSGAIPATIIYNKKKRTFYEQSFDYKTLETELKNHLKPL